MIGYGQLQDGLWDDLNFPIIPRSSGQTIAAYTAIDSGGVLLYPQWQVDDFHVCDANELVHGWAEGSTISWHLHLLTNGQEAVDKFLKFELIWAIADVGEVLEERTTITTADIAIPANTPSKTMLIMSLGTADLTGYRIGAHVYPRLKRITATGAAPAANPWIPMLQAHIQLNSLGSRLVTSK